MKKTKTTEQSLSFDSQDEFQRRDVANKLIKLLEESSVKISPVVLDGAWGTGKSVFCHKLIHLFKQKNTHELIYIDAFKADHANEPLLTILAEIIKLQPAKEAQKELVKTIAPLLRFSVKTVGKAVVSHILKQDLDDISEQAQEIIQNAAGESIDSAAEMMLQDYVDAEQNLNTLQSKMAELAEEKPIVIFIDELDRCCPNFAVSMLEVIKHTFDIPHIQFVLVTNMEQLKASINHCYGNAVDAKRYLDKFVKFNMFLPVVVENNFVSITHFRNQVKASKELNNELLQVNFHIFIENCIKNQKLSLREIETLVRYFEIYTVAVDDLMALEEDLKNIAIISICIYSIYPEMAKKILLQNFDAEDFNKLFLNAKNSIENINIENNTIKLLPIYHLIFNEICYLDNNNKHQIHPTINNKLTHEIFKSFISTKNNTTIKLLENIRTEIIKNISELSLGMGNG